MLLNHPTSSEALTSLALGAGEARDEEGRAATTEGPLHRGVPAGGGGWWSERPLSLSHSSRVPPAASFPAHLTAARPAALQWSSPCGSKTSPAPGSWGLAQGHSGRPGGGKPLLRGRPHPAASPYAPDAGLTWYRKLSLWKASRSFTCPAIGAVRAPHTRPSAGPAPPVAPPQAPAHGLLGSVVPGPASPSLRALLWRHPAASRTPVAYKPIPTPATQVQGPFLSFGFLLVFLKPMISYTRSESLVNRRGS